MPISSYEEIHKDKIEYQLYQHYQTEIKALQALGFGELHYAREVSFPLSALALFFVYPVMRAAGEVFRIESPLRYVLMHPLLLCHDYDTYGHIFGLGTKLVTRFVDGTILISCNFPTTTLERPNRRFYKYGLTGDVATVEVLWDLHCTRIHHIEGKGRETDSHLSLDAFEEIMRLEDRLMMFGR